jgi:hypothetical protein
MACFLPVRPFVLLGPSGLPSLAASIISFRNERDSPLLHFDATLASSSYTCHVACCSMSTMIQRTPYLA